MNFGPGTPSTSYDADLTGDGYQGEGPNLKPRAKFNETTFKGFRKQTPPQETLKTSIASVR
ncbi:MAG: hypothetical protein ABIJ57_10605 [Pseudomonadota bacterium]